MKESTHEQKNEGQHNLIDLKIIVNGSLTIVNVNVNAPLKTAVQKALEQTGNTGRPFKDWTIKWNDQILDMEKKIKDFNFPDGVELFLSLEAGAGG